VARLRGSRTKNQGFGKYLNREVQKYVQWCAISFSGTSLRVVTFPLTPGQESLSVWTPDNPARTAVLLQYNTDFAMCGSF